MKGIFIILFLSYSLYGQTAVVKPGLTMDQALMAALGKNFEIVKSKSYVDAARGHFWSSISLPKPTISLSHEFVPDGRPLSAFQERTFEINQSLEFPTNYFLKGHQAGYAIKDAENEVNRNILEISSKVKLFYRQALIKKKSLDLAEENYKIAKAFLEKAELKQKAGEGTRLESVTASMQLNEALSGLETAKKEMQNSYNELIALLNSKEITNVHPELTDTLKFEPLNANFDDLLADAVINNNDLKKSSNNVNIASVNKSLAWSSLLPDLNISYYRQALPESSSFYGFSFGISVPVWFLFDQRGQIQESAANYSIAQEELKAVRNQLELKLRSAFTSFSYEQAQIMHYTGQLIPQAEEIFKLAKASYDSGEINYVEFLQAKQSLIGIKNNYFNSLSSYYSSLSVLETAIGKLML